MDVGVGWIVLKPGMRDEFMALVPAFAAATRSEAGCIFFEMTRSNDDPDVVVVAQAFIDAKAHADHVRTPHEIGLRRDLDRLGASLRFLNIDASNMVADELAFPAAG